MCYILHAACFRLLYTIDRIPFWLTMAVEKQVCFLSLLIVFSYTYPLTTPPLGLVACMCLSQHIPDSTCHVAASYKPKHQWSLKTLEVRGASLTLPSHLSHAQRMRNCLIWRKEEGHSLWNTVNTIHLCSSVRLVGENEWIETGWHVLIWLPPSLVQRPHCENTRHYLIQAKRNMHFFSQSLKISSRF